MLKSQQVSVFDHMLNAFAVHGGFGLNVTVQAIWRLIRIILLRIRVLLLA